VSLQGREGDCHSGTVIRPSIAALLMEFLNAEQLPDRILGGSASSRYSKHAVRESDRHWVDV